MDTLPVMIKGLNRISIAVDHLTLLDTVLNNTLLKVTGDLHQQLSRLTEQQCPGDCALLLDEALKLVLIEVNVWSLLVRGFVLLTNLVEGKLFLFINIIVNILRDVFI